MVHNFGCKKHKKREKERILVMKADFAPQKLSKQHPSDHDE